MPKQFENPWNVDFEEKIGKEVLNKVRKVDAFVAGVGTGGTLIGLEKRLEKDSRI